MFAVAAECSGMTSKNRIQPIWISVKPSIQQPILGDMKSKTKWSVFIKNE